MSYTVSYTSHVPQNDIGNLYFGLHVTRTASGWKPSSPIQEWYQPVHSTLSEDMCNHTKVPDQRAPSIQVLYILTLRPRQNLLGVLGRTSSSSIQDFVGAFGAPRSTAKRPTSTWSCRLARWEAPSAHPSAHKYNSGECIYIYMYIHIFLYLY